MSELTNAETTQVTLGSLLDERSLASLRRGAVLRREIEWPTGRGTPLRLDAVFATIQNINGEVDRFLMFGADVSDRCLIVEEAMQAVITSSRKISEIVRSLNQIASQTNMLSLNAAVEAARAGESGAGFRVVSREIGALAARSTTESRRIADLATQSQTRAEELSEALRQLGNEGSDAARATGRGSETAEQAV